MLEQLTNRNVFFFKIFNCNVNAKTKDCAGSRPFQHRLRHHCFYGNWRFLTSPSISYDETNVEIEILWYHGCSLTPSWFLCCLSLQGNIRPVIFQQTETQKWEQRIAFHKNVINEPESYSLQPMRGPNLAFLLLWVGVNFHKTNRHYTRPRFHFIFPFLCFSLCLRKTSFHDFGGILDQEHCLLNCISIKFAGFNGVPFLLIILILP